jgi:hypothetical protein
VDEKVSTGVGCCPLPCGSKEHIKILYFKHVGILVRLASLVLGVTPCVAQMQEPNSRAQFRSQYLSHMMLNLCGIFFP